MLASGWLDHRLGFSHALKRIAFTSPIPLLSVKQIS
uniref:Uncharacterized protein n=1 Tax=Utricularia reniformis TaxID=192314 RepID=A0A1Y0B1J2_9LAMI|nr:hypothetical protein AEK19_MT1096 [Utricularia reniformis]ART31316.1 hypothetical protein AEK19_MT1096 [Utricularia reniformis]